MDLQNLESDFVSVSGEPAFTHSQAIRAIDKLKSESLAILGGELWMVIGDSWTGLIPQRNGDHAVYGWETKRKPNESWRSFVDRCSTESISAINQMPELSSIAHDLPGRILYNFTWVSEPEYEEV